MDVQRDRAMGKQLRGRYLWARDQLYCRRNEERHSGRKRELGRAKTFGGGSYRHEMVSYDAARHVARLFEACLRAHGFTNLEQTER